MGKLVDSVKSDDNTSYVNLDEAIKENESPGKKDKSALDIRMKDTDEQHN